MKETWNREQYKRIIMFTISIVLLASLSAIFACVWYSAYADVIIQPFFRKGNWLVIGIYALLLYLFTKIYGGYRIGHLKRGEVLFSAMLSTLFVDVVTYFQISLIGRRFMDLRPIVAMAAADIFAIVIWVVFADKVYRKIFPPHQMLLIYGSDSAESLIYKMNTRVDKYDICEAVDIAKGLDQVYQCIDRFQAVIICDVKAETRNKLLKYCFSHSVRTYLTPKISDMLVRGADAIHLFDTPLLLCHNHGFTVEQRFVKRVMDLVLCSITAVLAWPVMLVIAVAIKLYDGGPVIFRQQRLTLNGKPFCVYKFRSMCIGAEDESGPRLAGQKDERVTPVGKWIRRIRFDEFPQILNILRGDMSIVGPRPERPEIAAEYEKQMPEFSFRLKVKAGLTGYAQVMGKYNTTPYDKLKLDLMYIENYSLFLDLKLILMTIKILFLPCSAEGVSNGVSPKAKLPFGSFK